MGTRLILYMFLKANSQFSFLNHGSFLTYEINRILASHFYSLSPPDCQLIFFFVSKALLLIEAPVANRHTEYNGWQ